MTRTAAQAAQAQLTAAQADEARAQEKGDPIAIDEAKKRQVAAMDALYAAQQPEPEETVTLVGPNAEASLTDANGVEFVNGVAEGVPRSLAEKYVVDFGGYEIKETA